MSVTASRLGKSGVTLDWSGLASCAPRRTPDQVALEGALQKLNQYFQSGQGGFWKAPTDPELHQLPAIQAWWEQARPLDPSAVLFLGIGGSALAPIALLQAWPAQVKFEFLESPDPTEWTRVSRDLDPAKTLVVIASKSGGTFETMALASLALPWLGRARWKTHAVVLTDPAIGDLGGFARAEGIPLLPVAPSIGGRFSVFTPVGLLALVIAGRDARRFLTGAEAVRTYVEKTAVEKNALALVADLVHSLRSTHPAHVTMAYGARLKLFPRWWVQLWGESLGKSGKGFTPVGANGPEDQHSLLQLLRDGPNDKVTFFVTVDEWPGESPPLKGLRPDKGLMPPVFGALEGRTLSDLLRVEANATARVLAKQNRPHMIMRLDQFQEESVGALFWAWSYLTALMGGLLGVNPFDQPGVEEGKQFIAEGLKQLGGGMSPGSREFNSGSSAAADAEAERAANAVERLRNRGNRPDSETE